ncbi:MAG: iron-containing alcohol dehydrogenase [Phycisphaerae bacterium]|jgi:alcohol dehydrogenase|nr:iron-containing alcohol dehydrogenase [Phycisphaerae bacterium]
MYTFEFYNPVRVIFGAGKVACAGSEVAKLGKKVLVVSYEDHAFLAELLDRIRDMIRAEGVETVDFFKVRDNPEVSMVAAGVELAKREGCDCVLAVGGGSVMDAAKAIAAGVYCDGDLWNMVYHRHDGSGADEISPPADALAMLMIPTLPATGSEMNMCSVLSNAELKEKSYIWAECIFPKTAIIDPELTVSLPPLLTACAAADTISHVLEIYINSQPDTPLQHYFQEGVMRTVIENVTKVLDNPGNIEARANLSWASTCAINGWSYPGDGWTPMHQVGHQLTARHGVNHGASLSIIMAAWMETFKDRRGEQYLRFARRVMDVDPAGKSDQEIIDEGVAKFRGFLEAIGAPTHLGEVNVTEDDLAEIIDGVARVSFGADGQLACNPPVSRDDLLDVLRKAL